jgi:hypothetical protein
MNLSPHKCEVIIIPRACLVRVGSHYIRTAPAVVADLTNHWGGWGAVTLHSHHLIINTVKPGYKDTFWTGICILIKGVSLYRGARDHFTKKGGGGGKKI